MSGATASQMHGRALQDRADELKLRRESRIARRPRAGVLVRSQPRVSRRRGDPASQGQASGGAAQESKSAGLHGAGISTASGVADYASEAAGEKSVVSGMRRRKMSPWEAAPSLAHRVLTNIHARAMSSASEAESAGGMRPFVWVQQNHDGLPQKAGFPQEWLNEIHGAWYDPSNPVVPMTGKLRDDLFEWLEWLEGASDFALVLGTSLSGMNADRLVTTIGEKSLKAEPEALGVVIVSLQRTSLDHLSAVRIYATIDDFARLLCKELNLSLPTAQVPAVYQIRRARRDLDDTAVDVQRDSADEKDVFSVPYSAETGLRLDCCGSDDSTMHQLDLRDGSKVRLTVGVHRGDVGEVMGRDRQGHFEIIFQHKLKKTSKLTRPFMRKLGAWWVEAALEGRVEQIPVVNARE